LFKERSSILSLPIRPARDPLKSLPAITRNHCPPSSEITAPIPRNTHANGNPDILRLYVPRAVALLAAFPNRAQDFPHPQSLRDAAEAELDPGQDLPSHLLADLRDGLLALARSIESARATGSVTTLRAAADPVRPAKVSAGHV
ncbi:MAG: hypothetical protein ACKO1H_18325, partial [Tabrizicola sp.]